jgi:hypothetical protein
MTSEGLVTLQTRVPLMAMGGHAEGLAFADPGAGTPISANGIIPLLHFLAAVTKIQERFVVGFRNFSWAPK